MYSFRILNNLPVKLIGVGATVFPVGSPDNTTLFGSYDSHVNGLPVTGFDR